MNPWDNILGQEASEDYRPLLTGLWVALGWWRRGRNMALKIVQAPFSSILVPFSFDFDKLLNDEGGNDKTTPPFGKAFLKPGGMCAILNVLN